MAEPVSSTTASATLAAVSLIALFPGISAETVLGAFAGAVVFVLSAKDLTIWHRLAFFMLSMIAGCLMAANVAQFIGAWLPSKVIVSSGVGALVAASIAIRLLLWLISKSENPAAVLDEWRKK